LTRAFVDQWVPLSDMIDDEAGSSSQRAFPCLTKVFTSAGHQAPEKLPTPPTVGSDSTQAPAPPPGRDSMIVMMWSG
jgi:hypothetical protein